MFRKRFCFLPAFYLIMCLMKAPKNLKKVIFKTQELVSFWGVKTHFGKLPLTAAKVGLKQLRFFLMWKRNYGERFRYQKLSCSVKTELIEMSRIKYKIPWKIAMASFQSYENLIDNASNVSPLLCNMKDKSYKEKSFRSRALYIPYARHYNPRFVYFLPYFQKPLFKEHFFVKFWPYVWSVFKTEWFMIKSGLWWRA